MKTKYDWSGVPHAFKWLAQDRDGKIAGYTAKPSINPWGFSILKGSCQFISGLKFQGNWQDSLEERPK